MLTPISFEGSHERLSPLTSGGFTAVAWMFTAVAAALTVGRYVIRKRTLGTYQWDDLFHGLAAVFLLVYISMYTAMFPLNYKVECWVAGLGDTPSDADLDRYFRLEIAVSLLFWVIIYLVKVSFLVFYRSLFGVSRNFVRVWWPVLGFTVVTFGICFLSVLWACGKPQDLFIVDACLSNDALITSAKIVKTWCVSNVLSDITTIALPLWMLKGLQISSNQRIALAGLFLIATVDIVFDIIRTYYTLDGGAVALDTIWDALEPAIAVMVSALPTFRALLSTSRKRDQGPYRNLTYPRNRTFNTSNDGHEMDNTTYPHQQAEAKHGHIPSLTTISISSARR